MLRFFSLIARRSDVSETEFHDHWRYPHGTMGRHISGLRDYVQAHRVASAHLDAQEWDVQGVAISGFDTLAAAQGLLTDAQYVDHVQPDEPHFQNLERNTFFFTEEEVVTSRPDTETDPTGSWSDLDLPTSVQLLQFVRPTGRRDWADGDQGALGAALGAFRHAVNRPVHGWHGDEPPYLGVRQLWWPTISAFERAVEHTPDGLESLARSAGDSLMMLTVSERWLR
jgi:hypothetical protein